MIDVKNIKTLDLTEVYCSLTPTNPQKMHIVQYLNSKAQPLPVELKYEAKTGKTLVLLANEPAISQFFKLNPSNNRVVGYVTEENENAFEMVKKREPATNLFLSAADIRTIIGKQDVAGNIISAPSVGMFKMKFDLSNVSIEDANTSKKTANSSIDFDLSDFTEENAVQVQARLDYLKEDCNFSERAYTAVAKYLINWLKSHTTIRPFAALYVNNAHKMENIVRHIMCNHNVLLVGEKGTGKNTCLETISMLFDMNTVDQTMYRGISKDEILFSKTFDDNGKVITKLAPIIEEGKNGAFGIYDEVNAAAPDALLALHPLTDDRRYVFIDDHKYVKMHDQTRFFTTMNEGEAYEGTNYLNAAFRDRFHEVKFEPTTDGMLEIFKKKCNLDDADAELLTRYYTVVFNAVYNSSDAALPSTCLSQRDFIRAGQVYANGFLDTLEDAIRESVLDRMDPEYRETIEITLGLNYL
jgi:hypothetical protein